MRETCGLCGRPRSVCLCAVLPKLALRTATKVIILQHPHEARHKLATVSVVARCLSNCEVIVGRRFRAGTCSLLDECARFASPCPSSSSAAAADGPPHVGKGGLCRNCGQKRVVLLLFPTSTATDLRTWCQSSLHVTDSSSSRLVQAEHSSLSGWDGDGAVPSDPVGKSEKEAELTSSFSSLYLASGCHNQETRGSEEVMEDRSDENCHGVHIILLIVDGTWQHAKEMVKASMSFLEHFVIQVSLPHDVSREGLGMGDSDSILRKEPFAGCVSTMEAIARALAILEPRGPHIETTLLAVLQHMVKLQASHFTPLKPRPRVTKMCGGKEANQSA